MKIDGTYKCISCSTEFNWEIQIRQKYSETGLPDIDYIREGYIRPKARFNHDNTYVKLSCHCPHCDKFLDFGSDIFRNN